MRKVVYMAIVFFVLLLQGCISLYSVDRNVKLSSSLRKQPNDETGKASIFAWSRSNWEFVANKNDLFVIAEYKGGDSHTYEIFGITRKIKDQCFIDNSKDINRCRNHLLSTYNAHKVDVGNEGVVGSDNLYLSISKSFKDGDFNIEYVDGTKAMLYWVATYDKVKESSKINDYFDFIKVYPETNFAKKATEDMFTKFFTVSVLKSYESEQRTTTSKGLASSTAGTCKDVVKEIRIVPKYQEQLPPSDLFINAKYTLKRTYEPYSIETEGDPLYRNVSYKLSASNGFTVNDKIEYKCVMTSGRFHSIALSGLGRLFGAKDSKDTGISITLTGLDFDLDIQRVGFTDESPKRVEVVVPENSNSETKSSAKKTETQPSSKKLRKKK